MGAGLNAADVGMLGQFGQQNQQQNQANLDLNYQNFQQQQQQPRQDISWLSDVIRGLPSQQNNTPLNLGSPATGATASPLMQAASMFSGIKQLAAPTQQVVQQASK